MSEKKYLVLGSGGREHALAWHLLRSGADVCCAPGSDAIKELVPTFNFENFESLYRQCEDRKITEVIVGPEKYLAEGVADFLTQRGLSVFGPTKALARLECDKAWSKDFCMKHKIPTARSLTVRHATEVEAALKKFRSPYVVKASGLAAGKGVWLGDDFQQAWNFATSCLKEHSSVVIEEFLPGEELSYFIMVDGKNYISLGAAQDHKRLLENDLGPNTGGMGAYSPIPQMSALTEQRIVEEIVAPTVEAISKEGEKFRGFIFFGVMMVGEFPYVLEFNCRLGDPEAQALLMRLKTPLPELLENLRSHKTPTLEFHPGMSLSVVMANKLYPDNPKEPFELSGLEGATGDITLFHSGTEKRANKWYAKGGRLFTVNTLQPSLLEAQREIYQWIEAQSFLDKVRYRRDVGMRAYKYLLERENPRIAHA